LKHTYRVERVAEEELQKTIDSSLMLWIFKTGASWRDLPLDYGRLEKHPDGFPVGRQKDSWEIYWRFS
jgi:transposase